MALNVLHAKARHIPRSCCLFLYITATRSPRCDGPQCLRRRLNQVHVLRIEMFFQAHPWTCEFLLSLRNTPGGAWLNGEEIERFFPYLGAAALWLKASSLPSFKDGITELSLHSNELKRRALPARLTEMFFDAIRGLEEAVGTFEAAVQAAEVDGHITSEVGDISASDWVYLAACHLLSSCAVPFGWSLVYSRTLTRIALDNIMADLSPFCFAQVRSSLLSVDGDGRFAGAGAVEPIRKLVTQEALRQQAQSRRRYASVTMLLAGTALARLCICSRITNGHPTPAGETTPPHCASLRAFVTSPSLEPQAWAWRGGRTTRSTQVVPPGGSRRPPPTRRGLGRHSGQALWTICRER